MKPEKLCALSLALVFVLLCAPLAARAATGLSFSEIMYDPAGTDTNREWVEVYNGGTAPLDLSSYFLLTDGLASAHHALVPQGADSVAPGAYAVIVQNVDSFRTDYPMYSGALFDSSWSGLTSTSGKTLALIDAAGNAIDQVAYAPAIGGTNDGNSLQKNSADAWLAALPTPGAATASAVTTTTTTTTASIGSTASGGLEAGGTPTAASAPVPVKLAHMQASVIAQKTAASGVAVSVASTVTGLSGESRQYGGFHYAFGDGTAHDAQNPEPFKHTYQFPGSYVISFEYRSNPYAGSPDAMARAVIEVSDSGVIFKNVSPAGTVELSNSGDADADISGWSIVSYSKDHAAAPFYFPSGTVLIAGGAVSLPASLTGFSPGGADAFDLLLPSGQRAASYAPAPAMTPGDAVAKTPPLIAASAVSESADLPQEPIFGSSPKKDIAPEGSVLAADAHGAIAEDPKAPPAAQKGRTLMPFILGLGGILAGAVFALRSLHVFSPKTDTGDPREAGMSETEAIAEDIKIIE